MMLNDRDLMLLGTVPRYTTATGNALLLGASASQFTVAANGVATPATITLTPKLLNLVGAVTYSTSDGSVISTVGNIGTLAFAGMASASATITASVTVDSVVYTAQVVVTKVQDTNIGSMARVAYSKTALTSLGATPATLTTAGNATFPPDATWGADTHWTGSMPAVGAAELLFRSDGVFLPILGSTIWNAPYLNSLKVGSLSALTANVGTVEIGAGGYLRTAGVTSYSAGNGIWMGDGGAVYKLRIGDPAGNYLKWDGAILTINGGGTFSGALSAATGTYAGALVAATGSFSGDLSAARISVGSATAATKFFDPTNMAVSLNSSASGVMTYSGTVGAAVATSDDLLFKNNDTSWPIERRIRTGDVFFSMVATGVVDDQMSIWYRKNSGGWTHLNNVYEPGGGDGPASAGYGMTITISANDTVQFGASPTDASYSAADMGKLYLKVFQMTVIGRNF